ncbi:MAG: tetratricopeptide repeat protein [Bacteroidia bacterium]|nr:tetratricopeptide repeat protein [Bacteroidia bacterium]MDW8345863.1 tetratricopeptide repeat protein [Bacteroidia bacterium]
MKKLLWLYSVFLCILGYTQTLPMHKKSQQAFEKGKEFYSAKKYKEAIEEFSKAANHTPQHNYTIVSYLYIGLSFYRMGQYENAIRNFDKVLSMQPFGKYHQEANYHRAICYIEMGDLRKGLDALANIYSFQSPYIMASAENAFLHFLKERADYKFLDDYYKSFSVDKAGFLRTKVLELLLCQEVKAQNWDIIKQRLAKLNEEEQKSKIVQECKKFMIEIEKYEKEQSKNKSTQSNRTTIEKPNDGKLLISVLLPIQLGEDSPNKYNFYPRHFWYGVYIAYQRYKEKYPENNVYINLIDVPKDSVKLKALFEKDEYLAQSDFMIGPYFAATNEIAAKYAEKIGAIYLSPLTYNPVLCEKYATTFLYNASARTHGERMAAYILKNTSDNHIAVVYEGNSPEMKMMATAFAEKMQKHKAKATLIASTGNVSYELVKTIREGKANGVYFCSDEVDLFNTVISALNENSIITNVYSYSDCRKFETFYGDMLERFNLIFTSDTYLDMYTDAALNFRQKYREFLLAEPDDAAYRGFDLMNLILHFFANHPKVQLTNTFFEQAFYTGVQTIFNYDEKHDNQHLFILQYKDKDLIKLQ